MTDQSENQEPLFVQAAGGIVERRDGGAVKIAVIRRRRYGDEWALPKGKIELGETPQAAARREVREETGCKASITGFAGGTYYRAGTIPKIVLFWFMKEQSGSAFEPSEEVEKLEWLAPPQAMQRLSHVEERELIEHCYPGEGVMQKGAFGRVGEAWRGVSRIILLDRWRRLEGTILTYEIELGRHAAQGAKGKGGESEHSWSESASKLLVLAKEALAENKLDKGWKCYFAAQRMEIFALDEKGLEAKAKTIRAEADKLTDWRKKAIKQLIGSEDTPRKDATAEELYQAALIRDEHANNQAYKDSLTRSHTLRLLVCMVLAIVAILELTWRQLIPFDAAIEKGKEAAGELALASVDNYWMLLAVGLFGFTGATVSAVLSAPDPTKTSRIPELVTGIRVTLLRLVMGMVSALIVYVFLKSQFSDVFSLKKDAAITPYTVFALAFVAGFSERLVLNAVALVTKESKESKQ